MGTRIVVDGYNLIGASERYRQEKHTALEFARQALLEDLRRYKRNRGFSITVVFDGTHLQNTSQPKVSHKGIKVTYSRGVEKADDVILRMVREAPQGNVVVSSDRELVGRCRQLGAAVISSKEFEDRMSLAEISEIKGEPEEEPPEPRITTKKKGAARKPGKRGRRDSKRLERL